MKKTLAPSFIAAALMTTSFIAVSSDTKPGVIIYATGGTIAGSSTSNTDTTGYKAGSLGVDILIEAVPELKDVAIISGEQIANIGSSNVDQKTLLKLAKEINEKLKSDDTHGVVVTHGTDTLEETGFFLDLTVNSEKPVVMVGAMRPATAISADGPMNLLQAVSLAASDMANDRGTMIVLNDRIGSAFYTTKTNSTTLDTFMASDQGFLGTFIGSKPKFYFEPSTPVKKPTFDISKLDELPKVAILYSHQDQDVALLDMLVDKGAKGIVLAGNGNGSLSESVKTKVKELMENGVPVVRSTRTGSGFVTDKEEGIGSGYYNPQKSRILLTLALSENANMDQIREYFNSEV
ncbi:L-asparaginase [Zobellella endophytica]|uniref:L-asparaginase n=1 Tax=Zobellella endophytica TaxID=2116700 RepID=A0A2P7R0R8_9GAMM|nr:type II asparaginase [Zobellella endophytica]PSJ43796.1 L-asparaginase [Zobellella endophytica]